MNTQQKPNRLERLYQQREQLQAKIRQSEARERTQARKDDTRRKVIAGALALEHAKRHGEFASILTQLLDEYVTRPQDRALFDLPPVKAETPGSGNDNDNAAAAAFAAAIAES